MSLLTIVSAMAKNVGLSVPDAVYGSQDRNWIEARQFCAETCEELARRVDWGDLTATTTLTGDGTNLTHALPSGFSRLSVGVCVLGASGPVRPLTRAEWGGLTASEGVPRYFLLEDDQITLWPYLANGETVAVTYLTKNWCSAGGDEWTSDDDTALIDEDLIAKGLIARWRRQKGMDYADEEAEYEAAIAQYAEFDNRGRF